MSNVDNVTAVYGSLFAFLGVLGGGVVLFPGAHALVWF